MPVQSFLLCRLPYSEVIERYDLSSVSDEEISFGNVTVRPWPGCYFNPAMEICRQSTVRERYIGGIASVIERLRIDGGKTVICRQICGRFNDFDFEAIVDEYFKLFPGMFCFCFYHPASGFWMGASPELLLSSRHGLRHADTRALAGTRRSGESMPWSEKNIAEHNIVVAEMCRRIDELGLSSSQGERYNFAYGEIEHLCTPIGIDGDIDNISIDRIISAIHPTPAVGGYPLQKALSEISNIECWPRNCYGGYISVCDSQATTVYVMLRCVHFSTTHWAIYTGSGITQDSDPDDEWRETEAKAQPLRSLLSRY